MGYRSVSGNRFIDKKIDRKSCLILRGDKLCVCYVVIAGLFHFFIGMPIFCFTCDGKCGREHESWISFLMERCCNTQLSKVLRERHELFFSF